jgi:hypothetical protein
MEVAEVNDTDRLSGSRHDARAARRAARDERRAGWPSASDADPDRRIVNGSRRGSLIGATWLIGLGVVFLIQQAMGWSWDEAWPLFVILVGFATAVSTVLGGPRRLGMLWAVTWPAAWVVVGALLLASTTSSLDIGPGELIAQWWPVVFVVFGIWFLIGALVPGGHRMEALNVPLGDAHEAQVDIKFGAGELVTRRAAAGALVEGTFEGGVKHLVDLAGRVELRQDFEGGLPWLDRESRWDVGLTGEVPLDLRLEVGAYRGTIDLGDVRLRALELHTGASDTLVRLPRAAGSTSVRAEAGAASLTIEVPSGVAARIRTRMALGSSHVDPSFPRTGDVYQSADYDTAANRVDIDVQGGVGSLRVVAGP